MNMFYERTCSFYRVSFLFAINLFVGFVKVKEMFDVHVTGILVFDKLFVIRKMTLVQSCVPLGIETFAILRIIKWNYNMLYFP